MKNFHALMMIFAAGTAAAAVPALGAENFELSDSAPEWETEYIFSAGYEFFCDKSRDYFGLNLRFSARPETDSALSPEYYVSFGIGRYFRRFPGIFGVNLRGEVSEAFSLYAGARIGIEYAHDEGAYDPVSNSSNSESDLGLIYGVGCGMEFTFGKYFALTLGADYLCSTAEIERLGEQNNLLFSVGWKVSF